MNRQEYRAHRNKKEYKHFYNRIHQLLQQWMQENNLVGDYVVHHRDDNDEVRAYNELHYELWGYNEDGTFEYGKYVVFMPTSDHSRYHHAGEKSYWYGKTLSDETRKKISRSNTGNTQSDETRKKISENNTHYWKGKTLSDEHKQNLSKSHSEQLKPIREAYKQYKSSGGALSWNAFRTALKENTIQLYGGNE